MSRLVRRLRLRRGAPRLKATRRHQSRNGEGRLLLPLDVASLWPFRLD